MNFQLSGTSTHSTLGKLDDVQFTRRDYQHRARLAALDDPARRRTAGMLRQY